MAMKMIVKVYRKLKYNMFVSSFTHGFEVCNTCNNNTTHSLLLIIIIIVIISFKLAVGKMHRQQQKVQ